MQDLSGWKIGRFVFEGDFAELTAKSFAAEMSNRHGIEVDVMTKNPLGDVGFMYQQNGVPDGVALAAFISTLHEIAGGTKVRSKVNGAEYLFSARPEDKPLISPRSRPSSRRGLDL